MALIRESITLLHVSDMQFGRHHRFGGLDYDTLFQRLSDDLHVLEKEGVHPQLIVVSGDLAEQGKKQEFEDALQLLEKLTERLKVPRRERRLQPRWAAAGQRQLRQHRPPVGGGQRKGDVGLLWP